MYDHSRQFYLYNAQQKTYYLDDGISGWITEGRIYEDLLYMVLLCAYTMSCMYHKCTCTKRPTLRFFEKDFPFLNYHSQKRLIFATVLKLY